MAVVLNQLSVAYDGKPIIDKLDLVLPQQGIIGLSGPSGCGKTTLLLTLCGLIRPDTGMIESKDDLRVAMVFQEDRLLPWLTAADNLDLILRDSTQTHLWLERMQLSGQARQYPHQLSGGMKRRIALARALAFPSDLLLLDEPFKGMDLMLKESLYGWIRQAGEQKPVVLVTHDGGELEQLTQQIWLADGPPLRLFSKS